MVFISIFFSSKVINATVRLNLLQTLISKSFISGKLKKNIDDARNSCFEVEQ